MIDAEQHRAAPQRESGGAGVGASSRSRMLMASRRPAGRAAAARARRAPAAQAPRAARAAPNRRRRPGAGRERGSGRACGRSATAARRPHPWPWRGS
ncbi:hypothetical protein ACFPRL_19975 [Pseudoclavibacter helvolus]